jgi:hypothetical protein
LARCHDPQRHLVTWTLANASIVPGRELFRRQNLVVGKRQFMARAESREAIEVEYKGRSFAGSFTTSIGMVHVISLHGRKSAQQTGAAPAGIAVALLMEIIRDADRVGTLK